MTLNAMYYIEIAMVISALLQTIIYDCLPWRKLPCGNYQQNWLHPCNVDAVESRCVKSFKTVITKIAVMVLAEFYIAPTSFTAECMAMLFVTKIQLHLLQYSAMNNGSMVSIISNHIKFIAIEAIA